MENKVDNNDGCPHVKVAYKEILKFHEHMVQM